MLKPFDKIFEVDDRNLAVVRYDPQTGQIAQTTLEEHYARIADLKLQSDTHDEVTKWRPPRTLFALVMV